VCELRQATQVNYRNSVESHLRPRWGAKRLDAITVTDAAKLIRELRAAGLSEWTISGVSRAAGRVFKFARRHCRWRGENPFELLDSSERPKPSATPARRIYSADELAQTIAASTEPWSTLFRLASITAGRDGELLGLWWEDLGLADVNAATIRFAYQVDHQGQRVALKTEESKAVLPLPRAAARMLLEHKAHTKAPTGPRRYVFATRTGRPLGYRNVMRALYTAQERARTPDDLPTFPELFEHDRRGQLVVDAQGEYVPASVKRRDLNLPDFHALRHGAAMDCNDAEEARDLLKAQELERHSGRLPRPLRRSAARTAARSNGSAPGSTRRRKGAATRATAIR
jgi:site-specific recombinase XerD